MLSSGRFICFWVRPLAAAQCCLRQPHPRWGPKGRWLPCGVEAELYRRVYNGGMTRRVAFLGAGDMRIGPSALAALALWRPDDDPEIRLHDPNPERLDLADLFLRACLDDLGTRRVVVSTADRTEALEEASGVLLRINEDFAAWTVGEAMDREGMPEHVPSDPNRPTPTEQLAPAVRHMLRRPRLTGSLADALQSAKSETLAEVEADVLDLDPLAEDRPEESPHQILRWTQADPSLYPFIRDKHSKEVAAWLESLS